MLLIDILTLEISDHCISMLSVTGRTKLEPIAIVVLSVVMALASFQVILQALTKIVSFAMYDLHPPANINASEILCISIENMSAYAIEESPSGPVFEIDSIVICVVTIGRCSFLDCLFFHNLVPLSGSNEI